MSGNCTLKLPDDILITSHIKDRYSEFKQVIGAFLKNDLNPLMDFAYDLFTSFDETYRNTETINKIKKCIELNSKKFLRGKLIVWEALDERIQRENIIQKEELPLEEVEDKAFEKEDSNPLTEELLGLDSSNTIFTKYYGSNSALKTKVVRLIRERLADTLTFRGKKLVIFNSDIILNIFDLQQSLWETAIEYLKKHKEEFHYEPDEPLPKFKDLDSLKEKLEDIDPLNLNVRYVENNADLGNKEFIEAYNAIVFLTNFDTILSLQFGKDIIINNFGVLSSTPSKTKYLINPKNAEANKTWRAEGEAIDTAAEMPNLVKNFIITRKHPKSSEYLTFSGFLRTIVDIRNILQNSSKINITGKLADLAKLSAYSRSILRQFRGDLLRLIAESRLHPLAYLPVIYEILSNEYIRIKNPEIFLGPTLNISYNGMRNITTVYHHVFDVKNPISLINLDYNTFNSLNNASILNNEELILGNVYNQYHSVILVLNSLYANNLDQIAFSYAEKDLVTRRITSNAADRAKWDLLKSLDARFYNPSIDTIEDFKEEEEDFFRVFGVDGYKFLLFVDEEIAKEDTVGMHVFYGDTKIGTYYVKYGKNDKLESTFNFIFANDSTYDQFKTLINDVIPIADISNTKSNLADEVMLNSKQKEPSYLDSLIKLCLEAIYRAKLSFMQSSDSLINSYINESQIEQKSEFGHFHTVSTTTFNGTLGHIALARTNILGLNSGIINRDAENKAQFGVSFSRMLGSYDTTLNRVKLQKFGQLGFQLFRDKTFLGVTQLKEITVNNTVKLVFDLTIDEFVETYFVHNFLKGLIPSENSLTGGGKVAFLPCTNSDKTNVNNLYINLRSASSLGKEFYLLSSSEIELLIREDNSAFYGNILGQTGIDLLKIVTNPKSFPKGLNIVTFKDFLKSSNYSELSELIKVISKQPNLTYLDLIAKKINIPSSLYEVANIINKYLSTHYKQALPKEAINILYRNYYDKVEKIPKIKEVHYSTSGYNILTNQTLKMLYDRSIDSEEGKQYEAKFWKRSDEEALRDLFENHFTAFLGGSLFSDLKGLSNDDTWKQEVEDSFEIKTLESNTGKATALDPIKRFIYAKVNINGLVYNITSHFDLMYIMNSLKIKSISDFFEFINNPTNNSTWSFTPLFKKWMRLDYLFSQEWNNSTLGSDIAHGKSNIDAYIEEASRWNARNKRNVSNTAAMYDVVYGLRQGLPYEINAAIMETPTHKLFNADGDTNDMATLDGANFVNPLFTMMLNQSLLGMKVGSTIKPYFFAQMNKYGVGFQNKCAGFPLSNETQRNSPNMDAVLFRKSISIPLGDNYDFTKTYWGKDIKYDNMYFVNQYSDNPVLKQGSYYRLQGLFYDSNTNTHTVSLKEVDSNGNDLNQEAISYDIKINTLYDLYKVFGAEWSLTAKNGKLVKSEGSMQKLFEIITSVTSESVLNDPSRHATIDVKGRKVLRYSSLEDLQGIISSPKAVPTVPLPLKSKMIHTIADEGAVKHGLGYLNTLAEILEENTSLIYMSFHADLVGIQLDKEHHANDTLASLMTQVLSACASMGYSFSETDDLYISLSKFCEGVLSRYKYDENSSVEQSKVAKELYTLILKALSATTNTYDINFATKLALEILSGNSSTKKIPFSDPMVYGKIVSTVASKFNKLGIKLKVPGNLGVLNPSYNRVSLYGGKLLGHYQNPIKELLQLLLEYDKNPVFDSRRINLDKINTTNTLSNLYIDTPYKLVTSDYKLISQLSEKGIEFLNRVIGNRLEYLFTLNTPKDYLELKKAVILATKPVKICEVCYHEGRMIGRNLRSMNFRFNAIGDKTGERYNIYDLDSIGALFEFKNLLKDAFLTEEKYKEKAIALLPDEFLPDINSDRKTFDDTIKNMLLLWRNEDFAALSQSANIEGQRTVRINNRYVNVDINKVKYSPYESIVPKFYRDVFNLQENISILEILNDKNYFEKQFRVLWKPSYGNYDVCLRNILGKHVYIRVSDRVPPNTLKPNISINKEEDGSLYFVEGNKNVIQAANFNDSLYRTKEGDIVINTDRNGLLFYLQTLSYDVPDIKSTDESIWNVLNLSGIARPRNGWIYGLYKNRKAEYHRDLNRVKVDRPSLLQERNPVLRALGNEIRSSILAKSTAFTLSLKFIVARIPAQSMQSFMEMQAVDFIDGDINNVYVSDMLLWLQGSDFDIDAATFWLFGINKNGELASWSPFFNLRNMRLLRTSMDLPLPTGVPLRGVHAKNGVKFDDKNTSEYDKFYKKYQGLLDKPYFIEVAEIELLTEFLKEVETVGLPAENKFSVLYDKHHLFLNKLSKKELLKALDNYALSSAIKIAENPQNWPQALTSVDDSTGVFKNLTKNTESKKKATRELPGNPISKMWAIYTNAVGRMGIAITASSQRAGFLALHALNAALLDGSILESQIKTSGITINGIKYDYIANLRKDFRTGNHLDILLEALATGDTAIITSAIMTLATDNAKELELANLNATEDTLGLYTYGVFLGVPAKTLVKIIGSKAGLALTKIVKGNVFLGKKGMKVLKAIESLTKPSLRQMLYKLGLYSRMDKIISTLYNAYYADVINNKLFIKTKDKVVPNLELFDASGKCTLNVYGEEVTFQLKKDKQGNFTTQFIVDDGFKNRFFTNNSDEAFKAQLNAIKSLDDSRITILGKYRPTSDNKQTDLLKLYESYSGFIRHLSDLVGYMKDVNDTNKILYPNGNGNVLEDLRQLALGSSEMLRLGMFFGLNQGIPAVESELISKKERFENIFKDALTDLGKPVSSDYTKFDIHEFLNSPESAQDYINSYEEIKHTFNIPLILTKLPHILGYLNVFDTAFLCFTLASARFLTVAEITAQMQALLEGKDRHSRFIMKFPVALRIKAIGKMVQNLFISNFLYDLNIVFNINKGDYYVLGYANKLKIKKTVSIRLGTPNGNATFKAWMEATVIPNLLKGFIKNKKSPNITVSSNRVIKDLASSASAKTTLKLPIAFYSLNIDMNAKTPELRALLEDYQSEFAKLSGLKYSIGQNGKEFSIQELLYIYALIVNEGQQSRNSLMPLFEELLQLDIIKKYHNYLNSLDEVQTEEGETIISARNKIVPKFTTEGTIDTPTLTKIISYLADTDPSQAFYYGRTNGEYELLSQPDETEIEQDAENSRPKVQLGDYDKSSIGTPNINVIKTLSTTNGEIDITFALDEYIAYARTPFQPDTVAKIKDKVKASKLSDYIEVSSSGITITNLDRLTSLGVFLSFGENTILETIIELLINC